VYNFIIFSHVFSDAYASIRYMVPYIKLYDVVENHTVGSYKPHNIIFRIIAMNDSDLNNLKTTRYNLKRV